jgi:flagellar hook assembly protein FlgD
MNKPFLWILLLLLSFWGCAKKDMGIVTGFYNFPNPVNTSKESTVYKASFATAGILEYRWKLELFTVNGELVYMTENIVSSGIASPLLITWNGRDNRGNVVRNGTYTAVLTLDVTKNSSGYSGASYREYCYTIIL